MASTKRRILISHIYLWSLPILSVPILYLIKNNTGLTFYLMLVITHLSFTSVSLYQLRPKDLTDTSKIMLVSAYLLILGATCTFISATTFPTTALTAISSDKFGHYWTSSGFFISEIMFLSGLMYLNNILESRGIRVHKIGYLLMLIGGVLWLAHLAFRLSIMAWSADQLSQSGEIPDGYEMMTLWAGSFYVSYMTLTYLGFIAYGLAFLRIHTLPKWLARTTLIFGIVTPLLFGLGIGPFRMPIAIQIIPWLIGIYLIKHVRNNHPHLAKP